MVTHVDNREPDGHKPGEDADVDGNQLAQENKKLRRSIVVRQHCLTGLQAALAHSCVCT